ncbi:MAG TPA: MipA/OmpV family protein [Pseudoxanthomonas sp.]
MKASRASLCLVLLAPFASHAQEPPGSETTDESVSHWSLGIAAVLRDSEYAGEGNRTLVVPSVSYEGEWFYWRGATLGYRLAKTDHFSLDGFVAARLDGIDADDFGVDELAERGVDRDLLEDRDHSADAGLSATWKGAAGELELDARADITGTSEGYQVSVDYRYPIRIGRVTVKPAIGATMLSDDMANYYYGTLDEEVARGVVDYKPGSATIPHVGVSVVVPFASKWMFIGNAQLRSLPDEIQDSPLVEEGTDSVSLLFIGVSRRF